MAQETKMGWKKYLLIGSLALNVLIIGLVVGAGFKGRKVSDRLQTLAFQGPMIRALPDAQRDMLKKSFRKKAGDTSGRRQASREVRQELKSAISAVPFDAQVLRDVFVKQREIRNGFIDANDEVWIEIISGMSDAERAAFARDVEFRKPKKK